MQAPSEICDCCDYQTPTAEMTTWRSQIVTRVFLEPGQRSGVETGPDAWLSGPFLYRNTGLEQRVCVWCADRMSHGASFGQITRNRSKLGLVVCLVAALAGVAAFPRLQPLVTLAFWQAPEENGRRPVPEVIVPRPP
ncbi:MAG: hypothetical protein JO111_05370 [Caulobacteraceae bacterium]|nr:hypothetical protein [Caulobacteraceae bacterium]